MFKPHFGELPPYLQQRKRDLEAARVAAEAAAAAPSEEEAGQVLAGEALEELVRHLKLKWQSLNEAYVRLPCVMDTPSKKRRKEVGRHFLGWLGWAGQRAPHVVSGACCLLSLCSLGAGACGPATRHLTAAAVCPPVQDLEAQLGEIERDVRYLSKATSVRVCCE